MDRGMTEPGGEIPAHLSANPSKGEGMSGKFAGRTAAHTRVSFTPAGGGAPSGPAGGPGSLRDRATAAFRAIEDRSTLDTVRDNPLVALGIAFGVGFALAGSSGTGGQPRKATNQLKGAMIGGLSAAVARELRGLIGLEDASDVLAGRFGQQPR